MGCPLCSGDRETRDGAWPGHDRSCAFGLPRGLAVRNPAVRPARLDPDEIRPWYGPPGDLADQDGLAERRAAWEAAFAAR